MRYALIADIHSNLEAFEAVLAHAKARGAERVILLGDLVGYGADPGPVLDLCMNLVETQKTVALLGNHDAVVCQRLPCEMNDAAQTAIEWTRGQIKPRHFKFLARLPLTWREGRLLGVHASAFEPENWHYVSTGAEARLCMDASAEANWAFCGHVHVPTLYYAGREGCMFAFRPADDTPVSVGEERRWLAVAGSCGQPRDGLGGARYLLFDEDLGRLRFMRVNYDWRRAAAKILAAGLPPRLAMYLASE